MPLNSLKVNVIKIIKLKDPTLDLALALRYLTL